MFLAYHLLIIYILLFINQLNILIMPEVISEEVFTEMLNIESKEKVKADYTLIRKGALVLRAVNHKLRQGIIKLLEEHNKLTVTEIYIKLRLEQSVASQHLAILRRTGVVSTVRDGKFIYYLLNKKRLNQIAKVATELSNFNNAVERHLV